MEHGGMGAGQLVAAGEPPHVSVDAHGGPSSTASPFPSSLAPGTYSAPSPSTDPPRRLTANPLIPHAIAAPSHYSFAHPSLPFAPSPGIFKHNDAAPISNIALLNLDVRRLQSALHSPNSSLHSHPRTTSTRLAKTSTTTRRRNVRIGTAAGSNSKSAVGRVRPSEARNSASELARRRRLFANAARRTARRIGVVARRTVSSRRITRDRKSVV